MLPPLPPLPVLPTLPPLPMLAPLPVLPELVAPALKLTAWYPLRDCNPFHCGKYELGFDCDGHQIVIPNIPLWFWDGQEWADPLPTDVGASLWRGVCKGRWNDFRAVSPSRDGWFRTRYPRGEKVAPSFYDTAVSAWLYADPSTGEMRRYAAGPKWAMEWWHDGAPE